MKTNLFKRRRRQDDGENNSEFNPYTLFLILILLILSQDTLSQLVSMILQKNGKQKEKKKQT